MLSKKEINELENSDSLVLSIKKESEPSFLEGILSNWISLPTAIYFNLIRRKRRDHIIITKRTAYLIIRNRIKKLLKYNELKNIRFNSAKDVFELDDETRTHLLVVKSYIPSYEEYQVIHKALADFNQKV